MFKTLDEDTCLKGLHLAVKLLAALHDILQYLCAHAKLGSSHARWVSHCKNYPNCIRNHAIRIMHDLHYQITITALEYKVLV